MWNLRLWSLTWTGRSFQSFSHIVFNDGSRFQLSPHPPLQALPFLPVPMPLPFFLCKNARNWFFRLSSCPAKVENNQRTKSERKATGPANGSHHRFAIGPPNKPKPNNLSSKPLERAFVQQEVAMHGSCSTGLAQLKIRFYHTTSRTIFGSPELHLNQCLILTEGTDRIGENPIKSISDLVSFVSPSSYNLN